MNRVYLLFHNDMQARKGLQKIYFSHDDDDNEHWLYLQ